MLTQVFHDHQRHVFILVIDKGYQARGQFIVFQERLGFKPHGRRVIDGVETDYHIITRAQFLEL